MLKVQSQSYETQKHLLDSKIQILERENATLEKMKSEITSKLRAPSPNFREPVTSATPKTLVIGSSLVRNLDEKKLEETEVWSLSGAKMQDIAVELEAIVSNGCQYKRVIILAGGNDASVPFENMNLESYNVCFQYRGIGG